MSSISTPVEGIERARLVWLALGRFRSMALAATAIFVFWSVWSLTAVPVIVTVDGVRETVFTHRATVDLLLADMGLDLHPVDKISPASAHSLVRNLSISIERARQSRIFADGREIDVHSWATTPRQLFADADLGVDDYDQVVINGVHLGLDAALPPYTQTQLPITYDRGYAWKDLHSEVLQIRIYRAIPISVDDGNLPFEIRTTAQTVGEALRQAELVLYLGDRVQPSLGSPVSTGLHVTIQRSTPIALTVDGRLIKTRTRSNRVGDALTEMGIAVTGLDQVTPPLESELYENIEIAVTRIHEEIEIEEDIVPFETIFQADPDLAIDTQAVAAPGAEGITRRRFRVYYENAQKTERVLQDSWLAQEPAQRVIAYGQQLSPKTFLTADGQTITYWRKIRMHASSYSASTAGVSTSNPYYGRTRTGDRMRFGIVAVDPRMIPLRSKVYVPGYGMGDALDTGSAIISKRIDLGYDDSNLVLWHRWVDVYLLWPPPPPAQVTWVLPNWPVEK